MVGAFAALVGAETRISACLLLLLACSDALNSLTLELLLLLIVVPKLLLLH